MKPIKCITVSEFARSKKVTRRAVLKWINAGKVRAEMYGPVWLIEAGQRRPVSRVGRPRK